MFDTSRRAGEGLEGLERGSQVPEWLPIPLFFLGMPIAEVVACSLAYLQAPGNPSDPTARYAAVFITAAIVLVVFGFVTVALESKACEQSLMRATCTVMPKNVYTIVLPAGLGSGYGRPDGVVSNLDYALYVSGGRHGRGRNIPFGDIFSATVETTVTVISVGEQFYVRVENATKVGNLGIVSRSGMKAILELSQDTARQRERF